MFFLSILSIHCKIRRDRTTDTRRSTGRSRSTCCLPLEQTITAESGRTSMLKEVGSTVCILWTIWCCMHLLSRAFTMHLIGFQQRTINLDFKSVLKSRVAVSEVKCPALTPGFQNFRTPTFPKSTPSHNVKEVWLSTITKKRTKITSKITILMFLLDT